MNKIREIKKVTLGQLRTATECYHQARERLRSENSENNQKQFEAAADELYGLVKGVIERGAVYTYREAVIDNPDKELNPEDFD